jgi:hypothetical protein
MGGHDVFTQLPVATQAQAQTKATLEQATEAQP